MTSSRPRDEAVYAEPARGYASAWTLAALLLAGLIVDVALGGAAVHAIAWLVALVIIVGADVLTIRAVRAGRSVTVTPTEVRVGRETIQRASIRGVEPGAQGRVLGRRPGEGLPRGAAGLGLRLVDGEVVIVPTRRPQALRATLEIGDAAPEIRPAEDDEIDDLPEIEARACALYTVSGLGPVPDPRMAHKVLTDARALLVAGRPAVGYARIDRVDGRAHLESLAVVPGHMRRGIGSALLEAACGWATRHGYPAVTVCTFADVPWQGPFFARRGFVPMDELSPELTELRDWERNLGLDAVGTRIVMCRPLAAASGPGGEPAAKEPAAEPSGEA